MITLEQKREYNHQAGRLNDELASMPSAYLWRVEHWTPPVPVEEYTGDLPEDVAAPSADEMEAESLSHFTVRAKTKKSYAKGKLTTLLNISRDLVLTLGMRDAALLLRQFADHEVTTALIEAEQ
jgi:hypothetical protein